MKALLLTLLLPVGARAYDAIRFLDPIKIGETLKPAAVAADSSRFYVLDEKKSSLFIYDSAGRLIRSVGRLGTDKSSFSSPQGLAVSPTGRLFVADTGNCRIQILDADGKFLGAFGSRGSEAGELRNPQSVAVGADGRVYVADTGNDRAQVFTGEGILLFQIGSGGKAEGQFKNPSKIAVDAGDNVTVLDGGNRRLQRFDAAARFSKKIALNGQDFVIDPYGFIYTLDGDSGRIIEQDPGGSVLGRFGSKGSGAGQYKNPRAIGLSPEGQLLILDAGSRLIARVEIMNKLKSALLPPNLETKISVSGPSRSWLISASNLAPLGPRLFAYSTAGQFLALDEDGNVKTTFGTRDGKGPGVTKKSAGFAVSEKLGIFVSDTGNNRVQHFALDGAWKENIAESTGLFDSKKKEGRVKDPRGVAINEQGTIYVADTGNRRIDAFNPEGVFLFAIGPKVGSYELVEPVSVVWDKSRFVYFLDKGLKKIFKCEPSGAFIAAWGREGAGPGQFQSPEAMAFDENNYLYILDSAIRRVSVYTKEGRWMTDLFSGGKEDSQLSAPVSLAVSRQNLVISDLGNGKGRIVSFDLHPALAAPAAISTSSKEGMASLSWPPVSDPWTSRYHVYRSTQVMGPFREIGKSETPKFEDSSVVVYQNYFYRVATESLTKDVGPAGLPVSVLVAGAFNRSPVEISSIAIGNIFSANYKWYLKNSAGAAVVTNNVNIPFQDLKLSFRLKEFMDFGYDTKIERLDPLKSLSIPLIATLNNKILDVSEDTPVQAEFTLTYFENGKAQSVSMTKPLRVYSRNAIVWDKPERIANFITPKDPPVLEFGREVLRQAPTHPQASALNPNVISALHIWDALSEYGVKFFSNPTSPYEAVSEDANFPVDYTQFPRETLKRKSGQCDDLTTLIISLLDGAKIRAAVLDYPGHMALMFDTEADDILDAGLPAGDLVFYDGTYWVPLEATLVGKPFPEAVGRASYAYKAEKAKGKVKIIDVRKAWETFEPATMPVSDWNAEAPRLEPRETRFIREVPVLFKDRYQFLKKQLDDKIKANPKDAETRVDLGLLEYQSGRTQSAIEQFSLAIGAEPDNVAALNNLGNVSFLTGDYAAAAQQYLKASEADPADPDIWMNLLKAELRQKNKDKAKTYGAKALALDANLSPIVETLLK